MLIDSIDRQEMDAVRLVRIHPKAYEAKMKAGQEYNPFKDFITFLKNLLARRTK